MGSAALWSAIALWLLPWPVLFSLLVAVAMLFVLARLLSAIGDRKYDRMAHRKCINCGYDLRESKDRCPECGAVFGLGWGGFVDE
jgi:hypothetical protein